jgi:hypothetical protein
MVAPPEGNSNTGHTLRSSDFARLEKFLLRVDTFRRQEGMSDS